MKQTEKYEDACMDILDYLSEILNVTLTDNELLKTSLEGFLPASFRRTAYGMLVGMER